MHETGCSGLVHWDDPKGWDGEGFNTSELGGTTCRALPGCMWLVAGTAQINRMVVAVVQSLSPESFVSPWTAGCQATLSMGFPRQEQQSVLPFPSPEDFPSQE